MNESYCIKDKRVTPCVEPSGYQTDKNGRTQFYCHFPVCGKKKVRYVKSNQSGKKSLKKKQGEGILTDVGGIVADALYHHEIPWLAKKTAEMGRYGASELTRNKDLQKKAVNYGMKKLSPFIQGTVGSAVDELSTKVRSNKKYVADRPELDGKVLIFIKGLENFQDQKLVSLLENANIWELIILLMNNLNTILKLKLEKS